MYILQPKSRNCNHEKPGAGERMPCSPGVGGDDEGQLFSSFLVLGTKDVDAVH